MPWMQNGVVATNRRKARVPSRHAVGPKEEAFRRASPSVKTASRLAQINSIRRAVVRSSDKVRREVPRHFLGQKETLTVPSRTHAQGVTEGVSGRGSVWVP